MRWKLLLLISLTLSGCVNPYVKYYKGVEDARTLPAYVSITDEPKVYSSQSLDEDVKAMKAKGFMPIGYSSFSAKTGTVSEEQALSKSKAIGAHVVLVTSKYSHTDSGVMPLSIPKTSTSYTNGNATAYGSGGFVNAYGSSTTTTYSSQTVMVPYTVDLSDFVAVFLVKVKTRLGIEAAPTDEETRRLLQTNLGVKVAGLIEGSPAFMADILVGDIILDIQSQPVISVESFQSLVEKFQGERVHIKLNRNGKIIEKELQIGTL